jgi:DNA mismatch repair protein MutS
MTPEFLENLTPLFLQYYELKGAHPGCLLLMQCGDFYEAYGEDAEVFARELEIVLTSKEAGGGRRLAMAGVPLQAIDPYLRGLVARGYRVAVADQTEDPRQAKGLVRREVVRVVTAGTVLDPRMLDEKSHNFLVCLAQGRDEVGLAAADISTGDFLATEVVADLDRLVEEGSRFQPSEVILAGSSGAGSLLKEAARRLEGACVEAPESPTAREAEEILCREFALGSLRGLDLHGRPAATVAAAALLRYLKTTALRHEVSLEPPRGYTLASHMILDSTTRRNLELTETLLGRERRGSLLGTIDRTCTSMGARRLRDWMLRPLIEEDAVRARHDVVAAMLRVPACTSEIRRVLTRVLDIERLVARTVYGTAHARDLLALLQSLQGLPDLRILVSRLQSASLLEQILERLDPHDGLCQLLSGALADEPPLSLREGGLIRDGYSPELDDLRRSRSEGRSWISSLEERERETTGIRSLKVGFNQVFGYYLEITRANLKSVPEHYVRKQTLANAERFFTPELKEYESRVLGADDRIRELEYDLFVALRSQVAERAASLRLLARALSELDVLASFAETASDQDWVRPEIVEENVLDLEASRHPVVEASRQGQFVPNDCHLDSEKRLIILTGPNMSGKSTWLRQVALVAILAQMGSYVPARRARLGITDRVFTRVGASDDLHLGQSTFMVEMSETANIVNHATPRSLVVLDEIGRGTSTFDGLAIARAVAEHMHDKVRARTLFATHFHEMTRLERNLSGCRNFRVAVRENLDEIVFLHRIVPGGADRSYGIYVARLAGLPPEVLQRAQALLRRMEGESRRRHREPVRARGQQLGLFRASDDLEDLVAEGDHSPAWGGEGSPMSGTADPADVS